MTAAPAQGAAPAKDLDGMPKAPGSRAKAAAPEPVTPVNTLAEALGRMMFDREFRASTPDASADAKRDAWKTQKAERMKIGRYLAKRLERAGFSIVAPDRG